MSELIKIAKECGAMYVPPTIRTGQIIVKDQLTFTAEQLQATVEQVCKPLLEAMKESKRVLDILWVSHQANRTDAAIESLQNAVDAYEKLMGQDK